MKYGHTKLIICPYVWYKWDTDACWTPIWHVSDTRFYVFYLKILSFGLDMRRTKSSMARTSVKHCSKAHQTWLDTAPIRPEHDLVIFFSNYLMDQKRIQRPKNSSLFGIFFFEISIENSTPYFLKNV